jgi:hypothetical protein
MVQAFSAGNWLSAFMGFVLGGFVPVAMYALIHCEVAEHPGYWADGTVDETTCGH